MLRLLLLAAIAAPAVGCGDDSDNPDVGRFDAGPDAIVDGGPDARPPLECEVQAGDDLQPDWIAGVDGDRAALGAIGEPSGIALDDRGVLVVVDGDPAFEEVHLFDTTSEDPAPADEVDPVVDWGAAAGAGSGPLEFSAPSGVRFDRNANQLHILDFGNERVQTLDADDTNFVFARETGLTTGTEDGAFMAPANLGGDARGALVLSDSGRADVQLLTAAGAFEAKFGDESYGALGQDGNVETPGAFAIDEINDRVYVIDEANDEIVVFQYSDLTFVSRFGSFTGEATGIAVDRYGLIYASDDTAEGGFVRIYDTDLMEVYAIGGLTDPRDLLIQNGRDTLVVADAGARRVFGYSLSEIHRRSCLRVLRVTGSPRALVGRGMTLRVELLRPDQDYDWLSFRVPVTVSAARPDGTSVPITPNTQTLYSGMGAVTVTVDSPGDVLVTVEAGGLRGVHLLTVLDSLPERTLSGELSGADLTWSPAELIHITADTSVALGETLTIEPGTLIMIGDEVNLVLEGSLSALGTEVDPIVIFPEEETRRASEARKPEEGWKQIIHRGASSTYRYRNVFIRGGGNHPDAPPDLYGTFDNWRHCCVPQIQQETGDTTIERSIIADTPDTKGWLTMDGTVSMTNVFFGTLGMAAEFESQRVRLEEVWGVNLRGGDDNDGFYFEKVGNCCQLIPEERRGACLLDCSMSPWPSTDIEVNKIVVADGDDDGIDTQMAAHWLGPAHNPMSPRITNALIYGWADKCMSLAGGSPVLTNFLVLDCGDRAVVDPMVTSGRYLGIKIDNPSWGPRVDPDNDPLIEMRLRNATISGALNAGYQIGPDGIPGEIINTLTGVILHGNGDTLTTVFDPALVTVERSMIPDLPAGVVEDANLSGDPGFIAPALDEFRVSPRTPAYTAGPDGSPIGFRGF